MAFVAVTGVLFSCSEKRPDDPCCTFANIPGDSDAGDGQGLLRVQGSTSSYYYVLNEKGEQLHYQHLNKPVVLDEGRYQVRLNNSLHTVEIVEGQIATCSSGTLIITGNTADYYHVSDTTGQQLGQETLGKSTSFFPGTYTISVNNTVASAEVKLGGLTEIRTGSIIAHGSTNEHYYVLGAGNKQLNYNALEKPLAFFPGTYEVKVNNTSMHAEVLAGRMSELTTGNLMVNGLTDEYYYVTDSLGNALNYQTLNKPLALFPGHYQIKVNNTVTKGRVSAGTTTEFPTGSLRLTGGAAGYYYVLDRLGNQLNYNSLNKSLSFFPSDYVIKLGSTTRKATVTAGQLTSISAF